MKGIVKGLAVLLLVLAGVLGWLYRDLVADAVRRTFGSEPVSAVGRPDSAASASARKKVRSLAFGAVDSVVLSPAETASLLSDMVTPLAAGNFDSLAVELLDGGIGVSGLVRTSGIPRDVLGPLGAVIRPWEDIAIAGPVRTSGAGQAEWRVERLSLRGFPFPRDMVTAIVSRVVPGSSDGVLPLVVPDGVVSISIRPSGLTLHRRAGAS